MDLVAEIESFLAMVNQPDIRLKKLQADVMFLVMCSLCSL